MKRSTIEDFFKDLKIWICNDITPCKKGVRDLNGNVIDSPRKILWVNSSDIKSTSNLNDLLKGAKKTTDLTPIGKAKPNGLSSRYVDPVSKKIYDVPLSEYTNEPLPKHFADAQDRIILIWGDVSSGKTLLTSMLIMKLKNIYNFHSPNRDLSITPDATQYDWLQRGYHYNRDNAAVANNHVPEPTKIGEQLQQFPLYVESNFDGMIRKSILKLVDLPGEYNSFNVCVEDSLPSQADAFWFLIDGVSLLTDPSKTTETFRKLSDFFEVFPILKRIPIYVVLTKADLMRKILFDDIDKIHPSLRPLFNEDFCYKELFPSNTIRNTGCTRSIHVPVFNVDARKSNALFSSKLLKSLYPAEYLHLTKHNVRFFTVSSLSEEPQNGKFSANNIPFAVDELFFETLRDFNLY